MDSAQKAQQNQVNLQMRQQPWYQQWFQRQGLNPNQVQLNDHQRQELMQLASQNGVPVNKDSIIDPAGNVNIRHGFAGQPGWLKGLEIAALGATGAGLAGVGPLAGSLSLAGGGSAPVGAAAASGLGATEASTGLGATAGLIPGLGATSTTLGATGGLIPGLSEAIPSITGHSVGTGMATGALPSIHGSTASPAGGSLISRLMSRATPDNLADAGSMFESFGNSEATNRQNRANNTQVYDRNMLMAQEDRRANEADAMKKLSQTGYITSGGANFTPPTVQLQGQPRTLTDFGFGPKPTTDAEKQGAATLQDQLLKRLQPGGSYTPQPLDSYAKPGAAEKVGQYGGLITGGLGLAKNIFGF